MKIYLCSIVVLLSFMILGCSGGGILGGSSNTPIGVENKDDIGDGIEMTVSNIDSSNVLVTGSILFSINLQNKNSEVIEITRNNLKLEAIPGDLSLFTQDSVENVYDSLFRGDTIYLSDVLTVDQELSLTINDDVIRDYTSQSISLRFLLDYEDGFEQVTNMRINFGNHNVKRVETIKKKGPFEISKFDIINSRGGKLVQFEINSRLNSKSTAKISDIEVNLGNTNLNCQFSYPQEEVLNPSSIQINPTKTVLNSFCEIPESLVSTYTDDTDFSFEITFNYEYKETQSQSFTIPNNYKSQIKT